MTEEVHVDYLLRYKTSLYQLVSSSRVHFNIITDGVSGKKKEN